MINKSFNAVLFWVMVALAVVPLRSIAGSLPDFTDMVEEHSPAVVNISTVSNGKQGAGNFPFGGNMDEVPEFFRHFFGDRFGRGDGHGERKQNSMGSGFIVSQDGYILTNNHVVEGADEIIVRLSDRRELVATLIGADKRSDLAVLKVESDNLPVVSIGKSKKLKQGEWVFAIGSPFGFDYTVTAGIVSAIGRSLPNENYVPFIQTDVAINPGNSGGPLFNMDGEVVGINSQIYTRSGGFMGVSFAIPIDVAMEVVNQLKGKGYVSRGWLGVLIQEVNKELAESFGLKKPRGALVAQVVPDSPAEDAGLKSGDVIISYQGRDIERSSELPHFVGRTEVGEKAKLKVIREGKERTVEVIIGELPGEEKSGRPGAPESSIQKNRLNITVSPLDDAQKEKLQVSSGVLVTQVGAGPARQAGIRVNDVIKSINNQTVDSVDDLKTVVDGLADGKALPVLIVRQGNPLFVVIKLEN